MKTCFLKKDLELSIELSKVWFAKDLIPAKHLEVIIIRYQGKLVHHNHFGIGVPSCRKCALLTKITQTVK